MGDAAPRVLTVHHYSAAATRPANQAFVAAWKRDYGANETPNFVAVGGWDGMAAIMHAIKEQKGKLDPDRTHGAPEEFQGPEQPAGTDLGRPGHPRHRAERVICAKCAGSAASSQRRDRKRWAPR